MEVHRHYSSLYIETKNSMNYMSSLWLMDISLSYLLFNFMLGLEWIPYNNCVLLKQWRIKWLRFEGYFLYMVEVYEVKLIKWSSLDSEYFNVFCPHFTTKHVITKLLTAQHYVIQCTFCWIHRSSSSYITTIF